MLIFTGQSVKVLYFHADYFFVNYQYCISIIFVIVKGFIKWKENDKKMKWTKTKSH